MKPVPSSPTSNHQAVHKITDQQAKNAIIECLKTTTLQETYKVVVNQAVQLVGAKFGSIFLLKDGVMQRAYATSDTLYQVVPRRKGNTHSVFKTGKPYIYTVDKLSSYHPSFRQLEIGSDLTLPLSSNQTTVGVLSVLSSTNEQFTEHHLQTLQLIAPYAAFAITRAQQVQKLTRSLETQDLFISLAAHELKNPLTSTKAYIQLVTRSVQSQKLPNLKHLEVIDKEIDRVSSLVQEFLQANQAKSGKLNYQFNTFNIQKMLDHAIAMIRQSYPDKKIILKTIPENCCQKITGDYNKLLQVCINILENAAKFSESGKKILVKLQDKSDYIQIQIIDQGKGILPEDLPHIFERFYSGKNTAASGMGLGLFLVKRIIQAHKGKIQIKSKPDKGTQFSIQLPLKTKSKSSTKSLK